MKHSLPTPVSGRLRISMTEPARTWFESDSGEGEPPSRSTALQAWLDRELERKDEAARQYHARRWRRRAVTTAGILLLGASMALAFHVARDDSARAQMRRWLTMEGADAPAR
jgi:hypothetical protein